MTLVGIQVVNLFLAEDTNPNFITKVEVNNTILMIIMLVLMFGSLEGIGSLTLCFFL
jgi:hypothetical protein